MNRDRYRRSESETEESCVHTQRWRRRPYAESSERAQAIYVNDSSRGCRREARSLIFPAFCEHITWHSGDIFAQAASFARSHLLLSYQYLPVPFLSPDNDATSNPTSAPFLWRFCFSLVLSPLFPSSLRRSTFTIASVLLFSRRPGRETRTGIAPE